MLNKQNSSKNLIIFLFFKFFSKYNSFIGLLKKRYLLKSLNTEITLFNSKFYLNFFKQILNNTQYFSIKKIFELNIVFIYIRNNYKTVRFFFGYPVSGRTRSNGHSSQKKSLIYKNIVIKYIYYNFFSKQKLNDKLLLLLVEFFNKLWFFQWYREWLHAKIQLDSVIDRKYSK